MYYNGKCLAPQQQETPSTFIFLTLPRFGGLFSYLCLLQRMINLYRPLSKDPKQYKHILNINICVLTDIELIITIFQYFNNQLKTFRTKLLLQYNIPKIKISFIGFEFILIVQYCKYVYCIVLKPYNKHVILLHMLHFQL